MTSIFPPEFRELLTGPPRRYYIATLFGSVGTGLILALSVVYVHNVRHLSVNFATTLLAVNAVTSLAISPFVGTLTDRIGPVKVMLCGMILQAIGLFSFAFATTKLTVAASATLMVIGGSSIWGPSSTLLTRLVSESQRQRAYGFNFMLLNLGIGVGGLVSASMVNLNHPSTFTRLYVMTGCFTICTAIVISTLARFGNPVAHEHDEAKGDRGGWREVIADRRLLHYILAALILLICGYGSLDAGFSLFIVNVAHLSVKSIGVIFFFNTVTIIVAQLFVIRYIEGRSRTRIMGLVGVLWSISWLLIATTVLLPKYLALPVFCLSSAIFALGETFWSPVAPALVNQMAPEHLRGRYNAASGLTWGIASSVAPLIAGAMLSNDIGRFWPVLIGGGALAGGFFAGTLRRNLTPYEDGILVATEGA